MSLMFFISGLFVYPAVRRHGAFAFARDRMLRLGVPFAVAVCGFMPLALYPSWTLGSHNSGFAAFYEHISRIGFQYALNFRWPNGLASCPRCGSEKHSFIKTRRIWMCYECKKQFSLKVGTIFEDSPIALDKWMLAMWMLANCRNGISSYELSRTIGVMQRSAWFMLHRIREVMKDDKAFKMGHEGGGEVEVDGAYVGAKVKNMHYKRKLKIQNELSKLPAWKQTTLEQALAFGIE